MEQKFLYIGRKHKVQTDSSYLNGEAVLKSAKKLLKVSCLLTVLKYSYILQVILNATGHSSACTKNLRLVYRTTCNS
jgi:hypothetical protein